LFLSRNIVRINESRTVKRGYTWIRGKRRNAGTWHWVKTPRGVNHMRDPNVAGKLNCISVK